MKAALELLSVVKYGTDGDSIWNASYNPDMCVSVVMCTLSGSRTHFNIVKPWQTNGLLRVQKTDWNGPGWQAEPVVSVVATVKTPEDALRIVLDGGRRFPSDVTMEEERPRTATVYGVRNGSPEDRMTVAATIIQAAYRGFKARFLAEHVRCAPGGIEYTKAAARFAAGAGAGTCKTS